MAIIDFQTQLLSERISQAIPESVRKWGKFWAKPASYAAHELQPFIRFLPSMGRTLVEEVGTLAPLSHLLFESSLTDLSDSLEKNHIDRCVILSDPTQVTNAELIRIAKQDPRFISAIRLPRGSAVRSADVRLQIENAHAENTRILQIHPASDGLDPQSEFYLEQIEVAAALGWIIIIQTGTPKSHLVYRRPENNAIEGFENWFKTWPQQPFVIARMNFDDPDRAIDFAEEYPSLYLETSWQPPETIAEAVRRIGSKRILFGSDWPILGNNQRIGVRKIRDAVEFQMISREDGENILGKNAEALLERI